MTFELRRHMFGIEAWTLTVKAPGVAIDEDYSGREELTSLRDHVAELLDDLEYHLSSLPEADREDLA